MTHSTSLIRVLSLALLMPVMAGAQQAPATPGYSPANATTERAVEAQAIARPDPARARAHSKILSAETHVAGTPAQARTRDYVIAQMKAMGLETEVRQYDVFIPHPTAVQVWRVSPRPKALSLAEPVVPGDPSSALWQYPTVNGHSGAGDVTGEIVYVNYGLIEDYALLDSLGISVKGKIAVARYGRSFRGIKAREAEKNGATALLIYSDPQQDGYVTGEVYPRGPMRNKDGVQRGSVFNGAGDPATPGYPSIAGAPRLTQDRMTIPHIPVVPISYGNASELLDGLGGRDVPQGWQGGLPFRYHVGPGPLKARVRVADDRATKGSKPIFDTFGVVRGSEFPDEIVMVGGHRDGWGPGASDNVSGTVSVLEAARAVSDAVKAGHRPKRTIVFATWDAEEWGLMGSSEYVEDEFNLRLMRGGVAYLNQDVAASGARFGGGGSPSLRATLRDVARSVPDPSGKGSVYAEWRRYSAVADTTEPAMGDPGGGSDFAGFYNHLGMPIAEWGFRWRGWRVSLAVRRLHVDDEVRRFDVRVPRNGGAYRRGDACFVSRTPTSCHTTTWSSRAPRAALPPRVGSLARCKEVGADRLRTFVQRLAGWSRRQVRLRPHVDAMLAAGAPSRDRRLAVNTALLQVERALTLGLRVFGQGHGIGTSFT